MLMEQIIKEEAKEQQVDSEKDLKVGSKEKK